MSEDERLEGIPIKVRKHPEIYMVCPKCDLEVDVAADRCSHCGYEVKKWLRQKRQAKTVELLEQVLKELKEIKQLLGWQARP